MSNISPLDSILKECDPILQEYVSGLRSEISKMAKYIAHLETENVTLNSRVESLEAELKKHPNSTPDSDKLGDRAAESLKGLIQ